MAQGPTAAGSAPHRRAANAVTAERTPEGDGSGYFLYHSIGMFPDKGKRIGEALAAFAARWGTPDDAQWESALGARREFIDRWRILINARQGTLTSAENVTFGLCDLMK